MVKLNINLPLPIATALNNYAQQVINGNIEAVEAKPAFDLIYRDLDHICNVSSEWTKGSNFAVNKQQYIAGPGWQVKYQLAADTGLAETALMDRENGQYFVLMGDHREAFKAAAPMGWDALYSIYNENKEWQMDTLDWLKRTSAAAWNRSAS